MCGYKELSETLATSTGTREKVHGPAERLQQWSLEIKNLVRKAHVSADAKMIKAEQAFADGIKDLRL